MKYVNNQRGENIALYTTYASAHVSSSLKQMQYRFLVNFVLCWLSLNPILWVGVTIYRFRYSFLTSFTSKFFIAGNDDLKKLSSLIYTTVQICGNFWVTKYASKCAVKLKTYPGSPSVILEDCCMSST